MKAKQVLSTAFAAAMVFSTLYGMPVKAEEIEGGTVYIDKDIINVTLPTTASQKFYVDPQGLISVGKGNGEANAGTVVGNSDMYAVNRSSIPLALSVSYQLKDSAESDGVTVVSSLANDAAVTALQNDAAKKIAVSVSAVEVATDANSKNCKGHVFKEVAAGADITAASGMTTADVVYADTTAVTTAYLMTAETYKAQLKAGKTDADAYDSSAYEYVIDSDAEKASCVKLTIGGYCSTKADWSKYANGTENLKLDLVFKFKKLTTTVGDYTDAKVGTDEVQVGPQISMTPSGLVTITGLTAEQNIKATKNVVIVKAGADGYSYPFADKTVTANIAGWTAAAGGTVTYQLKSDWHVIDGDTVTVELTLSDGSKIKSGSVTLDFNL